MRVTHGRLDGVLLIEVDVHADARGFFVESYSRRRYGELGIANDFVQDNHARSVRGTIRGLHFHPYPGQAKLVRVVRGEVWDVVVDIRSDSTTLGQWEGFQLDDRVHRQLYVPPGFAHGYCAISDTVDVAYRVDGYYTAGGEQGIAWDDPDLAIPWPVADPLLSDRDAHNPRLTNLPRALLRW